jgi:hypothetical protein
VPLPNVMPTSYHSIDPTIFVDVALHAHVEDMLPAFSCAARFSLVFLAVRHSCEHTTMALTCSTAERGVCLLHTPSFWEV